VQKDKTVERVRVDQRESSMDHGCKLKVRHCVGIIGVILRQILAPETLSQVDGTDG
jgi:hypothetical protein